MPTSTVRFDHSNCKHATSGSEGKKARAACRKEHAAAAKGTTKKAAKPAAPKATKAVSKPRAARKTPAKPSPAVVTDDELTTV